MRLALLIVVALVVSACGEVVRLQPSASTPSSRASASPSAPARTTRIPIPSPTASPTPIADVIAQIDRAKLDTHMRALADAVSRDPRHPGHATAVAYIKQQLGAIAGVSVSEQLASYQGIPLDNIFARIVPPAAPDDEFGIICAHYDSTAVLTPGWRPALDPAPGADDNATGTAALLEMARILAAQRGSLHHPVVLAFFDGEELFFKGSAAYLSSYPAPQLISWVLNIDMVGFNPVADRLDLVYYTDDSAALRDHVKTVNDRYAIGVSPIVPQLATSGATILDAAPFGLAGIPAIALVERYGEKDGLYPGNPQFHTVNDAPDKVTNVSLWLKAAKLTLATALELLRQ